MTLSVPKQVHIVPLGYEYDRVLRPALKHDADKVVLLEHEEPNDEKPNYHSQLKNELRKSGIDVNSIRCNIFELYPVLGTISKLVVQHADENIYVNLSAGSKISAIGGMIACMVTRDIVEVTAYYVSPEGYTSEDKNADEDQDDKPVSYGMKSISELPTYPIRGPSKDELVILDYVRDEGSVTKKALIQHARTTIEKFRRNAEKKDIDLKDSPLVGEYNLLDTHVLKPLLQRNCVEVEDVGRSKEVSITEEGRNTLIGFQYLLSG